MYADLPMKNSAKVQVIRSLRNTKSLLKKVSKQMAEPDKYKNPSRNAEGSSEVNMGLFRRLIRQSMSSDYSSDEEREKVEGQISAISRQMDPKKVQSMYNEERENLVRDGVLSPDTYSRIK